MAFNIKFPKFGQAAPAPGGAGRPPALSGFLARPSAMQQMRTLGAVFVALLLLIGGLVYHDIRESAARTAAIGAVGEMRMLSQRLAKAAAATLQGEAPAFGQLKAAHESFAQLLQHLGRGGELAGVDMPGAPEGVRPQIEALAQRWTTVDQDVRTLLAQEKLLLALGKGVTTLGPRAGELASLGEQVLASRLQGGGSARELAALGQLGLIAQRVAADVARCLARGDLDAERAARLRQDKESWRSALAAARGGADADSRLKLDALEAAFQDYPGVIDNLLANLPALRAAKQAGGRLERDSEALLQASEALARAYAGEVSGRALRTSLLVAMTLVALVLLGWLVRIYREDSEQRAREAEAQRAAEAQANRHNQDAILRLMNELGDLADGDLTVTATVGEDITGAIADSINYTIEELRVLVGRINDAARRVTAATEIARQTSGELIEASQRQASEIEQAGDSALQMARSMNDVSGHATQSAQVARQSLNAAAKGTQAVEDSIKGMNDIRYQIQETSKRIKRLGESSQEIGEIVELISDITEQTNVLALNAAIQAAAAGDAGRGFSVVAEEVQRLAERSGEATKQIAALVKTIQTDTQDAVTAMEQSTRGVVDGAHLSDAAGQALSEIGAVSHQLAELIENISSATQQQAASATGVARLMQDILQVTKQTTAGTQRTAEAVEALTALASELKGSVAGFKVD